MNTEQQTTAQHVSYLYVDPFNMMTVDLSNLINGEQTSLIGFDLPPVFWVGKDDTTPLIFYRLDLSVYCYLRSVIVGMKALVTRGGLTETIYKIALTRFTRGAHSEAVSLWGLEALKEAADKWSHKDPMQSSHDAPDLKSMLSKAGIPIKDPLNRGAKEKDRPDDVTVKRVAEIVADASKPGGAVFAQDPQQTSMTPRQQAAVIEIEHDRGEVKSTHTAEELKTKDVPKEDRPKGKKKGSSSIKTEPPQRLTAPPSMKVEAEKVLRVVSEDLAKQDHQPALPGDPYDKAERLRWLQDALRQVSKNYHPNCLPWLKVEHKAIYRDIMQAEAALESEVIKGTPISAGIAAQRYIKTCLSAFAVWFELHKSERCDRCSFEGVGITKPHPRGDKQRLCPWCLAVVLDGAPSYTTLTTASQTQVVTGDPTNGRERNEAIQAQHREPKEG